MCQRLLPRLKRLVHSCAYGGLHRGTRLEFEQHSSGKRDLDINEALRRTVGPLPGHRLEVLDRLKVRLGVESVCLHGDTDGAVDLAVAVRAALADARIDVAAFAP